MPKPEARAAIWDGGAQALGLLFPSYSGTLAGNWIGSGRAGTPMGTQVRSVGIPSGTDVSSGNAVFHF